MQYQPEIKCATFDSALQAAIPPHIRAKMDADRDATITTSRMEMTNLGCALLEQMAITDIETRYAQLSQRIASDTERITNAKERIAQAKAEMRKLTKAHNKHAASKAELESNIL